MKLPILVWRFKDAPKNLRKLSRHGGNEDWLAVLPSGIGWPEWAEQHGPFGYRSVSQENLPDGRCVLIGAHA